MECYQALLLNVYSDVERWGFPTIPLQKLRKASRLLALRVISLRSEIWSLSGMADIDQAAPIKLDQWVRFLTRCTVRLTCKHARRAKLAAVGLRVGFRGFPRSASVDPEPTHLGEHSMSGWADIAVSDGPDLVPRPHPPARRCGLQLHVCLCGLA